MNNYNKETTAALSSLLTFMFLLAVWTGEYISLVKGIGVAMGVFGSFWVLWRLYYKILDKVFPQNNTFTKGAIKTITTNYDFKQK